MFNEMVTQVQGLTGRELNRQHKMSHSHEPRHEEVRRQRERRLQRIDIAHQVASRKDRPGARPQTCSVHDRAVRLLGGGGLGEGLRLLLRVVRARRVELVVGHGVGWSAWGSSGEVAGDAGGAEEGREGARWTEREL